MEVKIIFGHDDYKALASQFPKDVPYISGRATLANGEHQFIVTLSLLVYPNNAGTAVVWYDTEVRDSRGSMRINSNFDISKLVEAYENAIR